MEDADDDYYGPADSPSIDNNDHDDVDQQQEDEVDDDEYTSAKKLVQRAADREALLKKPPSAAAASRSSTERGGDPSSSDGAASAAKLGADFSSLKLKPDHLSRPCWTCPDGTIYVDAFHDLYPKAYRTIIWWRLRSLWRVVVVGCV